MSLLRYMIAADALIRAIGHQRADILQRLRQEVRFHSISAVSVSQILMAGYREFVQIQGSRLMVEILGAELEVLEFDLLAARHGNDIRIDLMQRQKHISLLDAMVAGHARSNGLTLVAGRLSEFRKVPDLRIECWDCRLEPAGSCRCTRN